MGWINANIDMMAEHAPLQGLLACMVSQQRGREMAQRTYNDDQVKVALLRLTARALA